MKHAKRVLVTAALVLTTSCSGLMIPTTPLPPTAEVLIVNHTADTYPLVNLVTVASPEIALPVDFEVTSGQHMALINSALLDPTFYVITHHIPTHNDLALWSAPLARDALVLVTHPDNPVTSVSVEQVRRVYRGFVTEWSDIGGTSDEIVLYSRETGAAIRLEFERLVMGQQQTSPNAQVLASSELVLTQVANDPNGIGYLPLSRVDDRVQVLAIETVFPSLITVGDNRYPLRTTVYVVGQTQPSGLYQRFFVGIQGGETQENLSPFYAPLPR